MDKMLLQKIRDIKEISQLEQFEYDNKLFIDPYRINGTQNAILQSAKTKIIRFFDLFFESVENKDRNLAENIGQHLHEINATKLGYCAVFDDPKGKGFSQRDLLFIFDEAIKVKADITDMPDILMLAERIGPDKVSDLTTNIIYEELLEFTKGIIAKYNLKIPIQKTNKWVFDVEKTVWIKKEIDVPYIDEKEILFLPNGIVAGYELFSYEVIYKKEIYPFLKNNPAIHNLVRLLKDGEKVTDCKKLKKHFPQTRATVKYFKKTFPDRYERYKTEMQNDYWRHRY